MKMKAIIPFLVVALVVCGCVPAPVAAKALESSAQASEAAPTAVSAPEAKKPVDPSAYLDEALDFMQANSINRDSIQWDSFRAKYHAMAAGARTTEATYPAIVAALEALGDKHSSFYEPLEANQFNSIDSQLNSPPNYEILEGKYVRIRIPGFWGDSEEAVRAYVKTMQSQIAYYDYNKPRGWIIDLRYDNGGNFLPMVAGIGPILGDGLSGVFILPDGKRLEHGYSRGGFFIGEERYEWTDAPYSLGDPGAPVAVLIGSHTASSGEDLAMSFIGRAKTMLFGRHTKGLTTSNAPFALSDGALMWVTYAYMADRNGTIYKGGIEPEVILSERSERTEEVPQEVLDWLASQAAGG